MVKIKKLTPAERLRKQLPDIKFVENLNDVKARRIDWNKMEKLARALKNTFKDESNNFRPATS